MSDDIYECDVSQRILKHRTNQHIDISIKSTRCLLTFE